MVVIVLAASNQRIQAVEKIEALQEVHKAGESSPDRREEILTAERSEQPGSAQTTTTASPALFEEHHWDQGQKSDCAI